MRYLEIKPEDALAKSVRCFWILEADISHTQSKRERVFPDGYIDVFFHYQEPFQRYDHCLRPIGENIRLGIAGPLEHHIFLKPGRQMGVIGARLYPGAVSALFGVSASLVANKFLGLQDMLGEDIRLEARLLEAHDNRERLNLLRDFFYIRLIAQHKAPFAINGLLRHIITRRGNVNVSAFASTHGVNIRTLQRRFHRYVGIPAKRYARLIRFRNVVMAKKRHVDMSYTRLAHEYGYFDQSHLANDFRKIAGLSPRLFFKESHPIAETINGLC